MSEPLRPGDFVYVHSDIPAGMTIGEWRAQRAANRPTSDRPALRACRTHVRAAVAAAWRAMARAWAGHGSPSVRAHGSPHLHRARRRPGQETPA